MSLLSLQCAGVIFLQFVINVSSEDKMAKRDRNIAGELFLICFLLLILYLCFKAIMFVIWVITSFFSAIFGNNVETQHEEQARPQQKWSVSSSIHESSAPRQDWSQNASNKKDDKYLLDLSDLRFAYQNEDFYGYGSGIQSESTYRHRQPWVSNIWFPYKPQLLGETFQEVIERHSRNGWPFDETVNMINLDKATRFDEMKIDLDEGDAIYYHGTDAFNAKSILMSGIQLNKTKGRRDFSCGYGFYVTPTFDKAMEWAQRKTKNKYVLYSDCAAAVIVFKISRSLQRESHLNLEVSTPDKRKLWEAVVSHFRNGGDLSSITSMFGSVNYIRGPVNKVPGGTPIPNNFDQICLCNDDYAYRFGQLSNICLVIFFQNYNSKC